MVGVHVNKWMDSQSLHGRNSADQYHLFILQKCINQEKPDGVRNVYRSSIDLCCEVGLKEPEGLKVHGVNR